MGDPVSEFLVYLGLEPRAFVMGFGCVIAVGACLFVAMEAIWPT